MGPTSGTCSKCLRWRPAMASSMPKWRARSLAVASPTWRMPRPNKKRLSVVVFGFFQRGQHVLGRLFGHAIQRGQRASSPGGTNPGKVRTTWPSTSWSTSLLAQAFDVHGAAGGKVQAVASLRWAGQNSAAVQRWLASPGSRTTHSRRSGRPWAFGSWARRPGARRHLAPTTSGITSPARAHDDGVAHAHAFFADFKQVVQRGVGHRDPAHADRRQPRHGRELAGAPDLHVNAFHDRGAISSAGYLWATAQRGSRVTKPSWRCKARLLTL